jgi:hypothetical protein
MEGGNIYICRARACVGTSICVRLVNWRAIKRRPLELEMEMELELKACSRWGSRVSGGE